jgi:hypothetical protein
VGLENGQIEAEDVEADHLLGLGEQLGKFRKLRLVVGLVAIGVVAVDAHHGDAQALQASPVAEVDGLLGLEIEDEGALRMVER